MNAPPIQYARTDDGLNIAYWTLGEGPPLVFSLLPTVSHTEQEWRTSYFRDLYLALAPHFRVVRFDHRGSGLSDRSPTGYAPPDYTRDLDAVLRAIGPEPAVIAGVLVVGAALRFALEHPARVSHLVLWSPLARGADYAEMPWAKLLRQVRILDPLMGADAFVGAIVDLDEGERAAGYARLVQQTTLRTDKGARAGFDDYDLAHRLPEIDLPTLVMHPSDGRRFSADSSREMAGSIPGAELVMVDGDRVFPWIGHQDTYAMHLRRFVLGQRTEPAAGLTHTLLFTDLAASTALTQRLGDAAAQDLLRAHNEMVRAALQAHAGAELKHTGDGIFAAFPAASQALDCARAIQQAATTLANPDLGIKIGLNAGEPIAEDDDLYGTAVQIAARVTDQAAAGEILCTNVVRELVAGKSYLFAEREPAALKGVEEPVRLFTLGLGGGNSDAG